MKKKLTKMLSFVLAIFMFASMLPPSVVTVDAANHTTFKPRLTAPSKTGYYAEYISNNCARYAKARINEILGYNFFQTHRGPVNAYNILKQAGFSTGKIPKIGAVAVSSGHIAVVEQVNLDGTITVSEGHSWYKCNPKDEKCLVCVHDGDPEGKSTVSTDGYGPGTWFAVRKLKYNVSTGTPLEGFSGTWKGYVYLLDETEYIDGQSYNVYLQTAEENVIVRSGPGKKYSQVTTIPKIGTVVHVVAAYENEYPGHIWYKLDDGNWIYSVRLKNLSTYKITYNANGGSGAPASQTKKRNQNITLSYVEPFKKGHEFLGWSTNKNAKDAEYKPGATYTQNKRADLYAIYRKKNTTIKLSDYVAALSLDNGKSKTISVTLAGDVEKNYKLTVKGDSKVSAKASTIEVSSFLGFNKKGEATVTITPTAVGDGYVYVTALNGDGEEVAKSLIAVTVTKTYKVSFNANGGTGAPSTQKKTSGKTLTLSDTVPTRQNYIFMGWATSANASTPVKGPGDLYETDADITYYAVWNEDYHIDWSFNNGTLNITGYGDMAYYSKSNPAPWAEYKSSTTNIVINSGVSSIGSYAFYGFNKVTNVTIPGTVRAVGSHAFADCIKLLQVEAPINMTIGNKAFSNCSSLSKFNKKSSAKVSSKSSVDELDGSIGAFAFENCENLQSFELEDSVISIGESAFSGCTSLDNVVIPESITKLEDTVFFDCTSLENVTIPETVVEISDGAFQGCTSISSIDIPESVNNLGEQAFAGCSGLESVELSENVSVVGDSLFANCTSLTEVELPENMEVLGDSMFSGCTALQSIDLPDNLNNLGDGTFFGCTSLSSVDIPDSVSEIGSNTFSASAIETIEIPVSVATIDDFAFYNCKNLKTVSLPDNLLDIGSCAFASCAALESVEIPSSVREISSGAFMYCTSLNSVLFDDVGISIEDEAFAGCTSLRNVEIPESAVYVSSTAFSECSSTLTVSCYSTSMALNGVKENGVDYKVIYPVSSVEIKGSKNTLTKGETLKLEAVITPDNATNKNLTWHSENEDIATVSNTGVVTAISSGTAIISAKTEDGNYVAEYQVECIVPVESIVLNQQFDTVYVDFTYFISYALNPGSPTNIDVVFSSSDEKVATVSDEGIINVLSEGTTVITIKSADGYATKSFEISAEKYVPVDEITPNMKEVSLYVGESFQINATLTPSNATSPTIYYYSVDDDIATVNDKGEITAVNEGVVDIVCVADTVETVCTVTVLKHPAKVNGVSFTLGSYSMSYKAIVNLSPKIDAEEDCYYTVEYNSSNSSVVAVDKDGNVTANGTGEAVITVTVTDEYGNAVEDSCKITVSYAWWQWLIIIFLFGWIWY